MAEGGKICFLLQEQLIDQLAHYWLTLAGFDPKV